MLKKQSVKKKLLQKKLSLMGILVLFVGLFVFLLVAHESRDHRTLAAGEQTDRTSLSYTANGYTSQYHLYAGGLDWTKTVGLLIYADGSGEYGLKNPTSTYLMAGATGMIAVAKKHNMILLTPFSPNKACSDGDGSCWYLGDPPGYTKWAEALVASIESQYPIDKKRVAFGGYSSGAELATIFWTPSGAAQRTMDDGVIVAISYGGPAVNKSFAYTPAFKSNVHMTWNVGDQDPSLNDVQEGYDFYTGAGFQTTLEKLPGVDHNRTGDFGPVMDAQITAHVPAATAVGSQPPVTGVVPTYVCGGSNACVPSGSPSPTLTAVTPEPTLVPSLDPDPSVIPPGETITPVPSDSSPTPPTTRNGQGFIGLLLGLLALLLQFFASLFR